MWLFLYEIIFSTLSLVAIAAILAYYNGVRSYDYWKKKGVLYLRPKYPYLGNTFEAAFSLKPLHVNQLETYKYFHNKPFGGIFTFTQPTLFVRDPSLLETIMIKDFNSFYNRGTGGVDIENDPLSAHLIHLEDQQWKFMRQKLTPTFTSGKIKGMHPQLLNSCDALVNYIEQYSAKGESLEVREVMAKFSTDVIGSCAFGINTNALSDKDSEFIKYGANIFKNAAFNRLRLFVRMAYPKIIKVLKWKLLDKATENFFISMIKSTISYREKNNVVRNDFVQLLLEIKNQDASKKNEQNQEKHQIAFDEKLIAANAFVFFAAGFETTSSTLGYCLYELSLNQNIQELAYKHVVSVLKSYGGEITFEAVNNMTYLRQIFAETLRMHPPVAELRRVATKDYILPGTDVLLPKGTPICIPIYSLHYDSDHFPEPEIFKPERFDKENKLIKKGTYLSFGDGPRICIGKRFAQMEMEVAMVKLLLNYKFTINSKTISPLVYKTSDFLLVPIGGIWIDMHKRHE